MLPKYPIAAFFVPVLLASAAQADEGFRLIPPQITLDGPFARAQILAEGLTPEAEATPGHDLTRTVIYGSANRDIVEVDPQGRLQATGEGTTTVTATHQGTSRLLTVTVNQDPQGTVDFIRDVRPILNKTGCASAACHASQYGKGGFKLSVFGFDPQADYEAIARESRQRRISLASPDASLFLRKPSMGVSHGGGLRLHPDSVEYQTLRTWIDQGTPGPQKDFAKVVRLQVTPQQRRGKIGYQQQLRVVAEYSDGHMRDVTALAKYDSMDEGIVAVTKSGYATTVGKGQAGVMVRYEGQADVATFVVPFSEAPQLESWEHHNFVDELAAAKFRELGLQPSGLCDDATFIRRAFLDAIGGLPTREQTQAFIASSDPQKREHLVDQLLGFTGDPKLDIYNDRYAAYWTLKWSDLIRNNSNTLGEQGMWALHNWIKESFRTNKPFDQFVRELVTAKGSIYSNGPANYFRINRDSSALTESTAQLFLGVRLECAKCHHHPFEKYSQADYYSLAAFFSRVTSKNSEEFGIFGRETVVMVRDSGEVTHPRTRQRMQPTPLGGEPIDDPLDRRLPLAAWLTSKDNKLFAQSVVNRYMGYLLGRGLVEPIDDLRSTNPPSNAALLDALSKWFIDHDFDLKQVMRVVMTSRLYQLQSQPTAANASDRRFYSHYYVKRIAAEPLLDAIDQVTGVKTKFKSLPLGTNATELPDAEYPNYFLTTFAKPRRASVCECERMADENLTQALHTLNGDTLASKISNPAGFIAKLLAAKQSHEEMVSAIYMTALCRNPTEQEMKLSQQFLEESPTPKECYEDLLWALVNSKQFLFVR